MDVVRYMLELVMKWGTYVGGGVGAEVEEELKESEVDDEGSSAQLVESAGKDTH